MTRTSASEQPVWVEGPTGRLFGILHRPPAARDASICVIMLNSGMQNRTGPERLYVKVARRFARAGVAVLRADLAGCGDSVSENRETHFDSHRAADVDAFIRYAEATLRPGALLVQGLCAGSRVALKAAARNKSVDGVLAWSTTIYTAARNMPQSPEATGDRSSSAVIVENLKRLIRFVVKLKFLNPVWWKKRFVAQRSFFRDALEIRSSLRNAKRLGESGDGGSTFIDATDRYLADGGKVLFLYGSQDRMSLNEFVQRFPRVGTNPCENQSYAVVKDGSHTFASRAIQEAVTRVCLNWIRLHYLEAAESERVDVRVQPALEAVGETVGSR